MNSTLEEIQFDRVEVLNRLSVRDNPSLREVHLGALREATSVIVTSGDALESISLPELNQLETLTSLDGLESLSRVGNFSIQSNYALTDLQGIESIEVVDVALTFSNNTSLPTCEAERPLQHLGEAVVGEASGYSSTDDDSICGP